ncbi:MAG TPA: T9SS type A sorting domain-containing protein [bacterium]|nr:T9SS type A sorting domain-containing protein [bacterium]
MKMKARFVKRFERLFAGQGSPLILTAFILGAPLSAQLPTASEIASQMTIGWNVGNSLEVPSGETGWGNPKISRQLIDAVRNAGFNTIRIPCAWDNRADPSTLEIDENWLDRVREVIDYCHANDMYVILNGHWDGGWLENNVTEARREEVNTKQEAYWTQIADYFNDYDERLLFAGSNEPNVENAAQMAVLMSYHQTFIDAVRATGGNNASRVLVIQGPSTDIDKTNRLMTSMPADHIADRLMAEIHYYTPWNFCGLTEDASWGKMFYFWGKDYHSETNPGRNATWGEEDVVETLFRSMKTRFVDQGIPVILGEYGATKRSALTGDDLILHIASREYYYRYVTHAAIRYGLIPFCWDNGYAGNHGCAVFDRHTGEAVDPGVLEALMEGAKPSTPVQEHRETGGDPGVEHLSVLPNPVSSSAGVRLYLKEAARVNISVFNVLGQKVADLGESAYGPGIHRVAWETGRFKAGVYFIRFDTGSQVWTRKIQFLP